MSRDERGHLYDLAVKYIKRNGLAIEIGTWMGASAIILAEICKQKGARLISIDLFNNDLHGKRGWKGADSNFMSLTLNNLRDLSIHFFTGESQKIVSYLQGNIADLIFIDGDHHLPGVKIDIEEYWNKLKVGGLYCGHDYSNESDVKDVVDKFLVNFDLYETIWSKVK